MIGRKTDLGMSPLEGGAQRPPQGDIQCQFTSSDPNSQSLGGCEIALGTKEPLKADVFEVVCELRPLNSPKVRLRDLESDSAVEESLEKTHLAHESLTESDDSASYASKKQLMQEKIAEIRSRWLEFEELLNRVRVYVPDHFKGYSEILRYENSSKAALLYDHLLRELENLIYFESLEAIESGYSQMTQPLFSIVESMSEKLRKLWANHKRTCTRYKKDLYYWPTHKQELVQELHAKSDHQEMDPLPEGEDSQQAPEECLAEEKNEDVQVTPVASEKPKNQIEEDDTIAPLSTEKLMAALRGGR